MLRCPTPTAGPRRLAQLALALLLGALAALAAGCSTAAPRRITAANLAEAQTFPFFPIFWVGPSFHGNQLSSADGLGGYIEKIGTSVYYGDCLGTKGVFGGGSCGLPLQITTVIYRSHLNAPLGSQRNMVIRGVPAVVYDHGHSIELYSGRTAIDIFSDSYANALRAAEELRPVNAPGSATADLPPPVFCPGLTDPLPLEVAEVYDNLPGRICQRDEEQRTFLEGLKG